MNGIDAGKRKRTRTFWVMGSLETSRLYLIERLNGSKSRAEKSFVNSDGEKWNIVLLSALLIDCHLVRNHSAVGG